MPPRPAVEIQREAISRRGFFRRRTFWDALLAEVASTPVVYQGYSFGYHADLYRLELTPESRARPLTRRRPLLGTCEKICKR